MTRGSSRSEGQDEGAEGEAAGRGRRYGSDNSEMNRADMGRETLGWATGTRRVRDQGGQADREIQGLW